MSPAAESRQADIARTIRETWPTVAGIWVGETGTLEAVFRTVPESDALDVNCPAGYDARQVSTHTVLFEPAPRDD